MTRLSFIPAVAATGFLLASCASTDASNAGAAAARTSGHQVVIGDADELLPGSTATDWRTYADDLVVVQLVRTSRLAPSDEELKADEGFIGRALDFRIERTVWTRPGADPAPAELELQLDGWTFQGDQESPLRFDGEPMLVTGNTYLMPIVHMTQGRLVDQPYWSNLSVAAILPMQAGVIGQGDVLVGGADARTPVADQLWGENEGDAAQLLAATPLPKSAEPYMSLSPTDRLSAISQGDDPS